MRTPCTLLRAGVVEYEDAQRLQQLHADRVRAGADPVLILLQHPPTFTIGPRGKPEHLLLSEDAYTKQGASVYRTDRGGDVTFHGPGQIVGYPIINIRALGMGPATYVRALESLLIDVLSGFGIAAGRSERNAGVWVDNAKIAAIGIRVVRGVTTHGFALNVSTDLSHFEQIVACGLPDAGVTSMRMVAGRSFEIEDVEIAIAQAFARAFGVRLFDGGATTWQTAETQREEAVIGR